MSSYGIAATGLFTAEVWRRAGLDQAELFGTGTGRFMHACFRLFARATGPTLPDFLRRHDQNLLWRHQTLTDWLVSRSPDIVVELACGYSPRGISLAKRMPPLQYYDTDLPHVIARKSSRMRTTTLPSNYHTQSLNALKPHTLQTILPNREAPAINTAAVISEGLLLYLSPPQREALWKNVLEFLRRYTSGYYSFEIYLANGFLEVGRAGRWYAKALSLLTGTDVLANLFVNVDAALAAICAIGFTDARVIATNKTSNGAAAQCAVLEAAYRG